LLSCGLKENPPNQESQPKIFNGREANDKVGVFFIYGGCTAVLVAPGTLLTAGHCFSSYLPSSLANPQGKVHYEVMRRDFPITRIQVAEFAMRNQIRVHPNDLNRPGFDLAIVEFDDSGQVPLSHVQKFVREGFEKPLRPLINRFTVQGYGYTEDPGPNEPDAQVEVPRSLQQANLDYVSPWGLFGQELYFTGAANICNGDSGGPVYFGNGADKRLAGISIATNIFYFGLFCGSYDPEPTSQDSIAINLGHPAVREWITRQTDGRVLFD
jgi:hypothetical protein